jgi:WD40 repeat protein
MEKETEKALQDARPPQLAGRVGQAVEAAGDRSPYDFDVFISYATEPDYGLARQLESFVETFHRLPTLDKLPLKPLRVCVDGSDFKAKRESAAVGSTIEHYLARSRTLLVLCSRNARLSPWVDKELRWFITNRGRDAVMLALTEGEELSQLGEVFPPAVIEAGLHEHIAYDFRGARRHGRQEIEALRDYEDERTRLAAALYDRPASEIRPIWFREQRRQARNRARVFASVTLVLLSLLAAAVYFFLNAETERGNTEAARKDAVAEAARARHQSYVASVNFARRAIDEGDVPTALRLLKEQEPAGYEDLRDFEWWHLIRRATMGQERISMPEAELHTVSVSADGRLVAAAGRTGERESGTDEPPQPVYVWARGLHAPRLLQGHVGPVEVVRFSPITPVLVSGGRDELKVWDAESGNELHSLKFASVRGAAFSPDGRTLAVAHSDRITLLDTANWAKTGELSTRRVPNLSELVFSPDGERLAARGISTSVPVWDVASREPLLFIGNAEYVLSLAWSAGTNLLATGTRDGAVLLWDIDEQDEPVAELSGYPRPVRALAFTADGKTLAIGLGGSLPGDGGSVIHLTDIATGTPRGMLTGHKKSVTSLAFTPSGEALVSSGDEGAMVVWDVPRASYLTYFDGQGIKQESALAFSRDGALLASGDGGGGIHVRVLNTGAPTVIPSAHGGRVSGLSFDPAGRLVSAGEDGALRLWEPDSGDTSRVLFESSSRLTDVQFSPDGSKLAAAACGGGATTRLWEWPSFVPLTPVAQNVCASFIAWSPDGQHFVTGGGDYEHAAPNTVFVWRVGEQKPLKVLEGHSRWPACAAFSPDGRQLVTGDKNGELIVWDFAAGAERHRIRGHTNWVRGVTYSPAGRVIASAGMDGLVRIWDAATWQERATFYEGQNTLNALAFHPDGKILVAAGATMRVGGRIFVWAGADSVPTTIAPHP